MLKNEKIQNLLSSNVIWNQADSNKRKGKLYWGEICMI